MMPKRLGTADLGHGTFLLIKGEFQGWDSLIACLFVLLVAVSYSWQYVYDEAFEMDVSAINSFTLQKVFLKYF